MHRKSRRKRERQRERERQQMSARRLQDGEEGEGN